MKPMRVTAHLLDGRFNSSDGFIQLDALLAWSWMKENHPDMLENGQIGRDELIEPILPLRKLEDGRWSASSGFYVQLHESIEYWHRRFDDALAADRVDFGGKRGKVRTTAGEMKAYRMPQIIRVAERIEFFAVGDLDEVQRLLNAHIQNIGKKSAQGYGSIREWSVEDWHEDWSAKGPYGIMKPTPIKPGDSLPIDFTYQIRSFGIKPPYWLPANSKICLLPNVRRDKLFGIDEVVLA